jgi:diadenosine tetraphosphate (Ap4A) HIT family hydrolase
MDCLFCRIISGDEKSWKIYEDDNHVAFLTPFPNTPGFTVLVTKEHFDSNVLRFPEERFLEMMKTARKLAHHLDERLGTKRTGLIIEGMGINHAHVKLIPMHGIPEGEWKPMLSNRPFYSEKYDGYLATYDGPRMSDEDLNRIRITIASGSQK